MTVTSSLPRLDGQLLAKGSPGYEEARCRNFAVNAHGKRTTTKNENTAPSYIALCQSVGDVQACIQFAMAQDLTVTVRTGGHNWFGCYLRENAFLIDMSHFNALEIDAEAGTATVGPAVVGNDLNEAAAKSGLCFSSGHCVGVPLGGFLLGGGVGWFQPYFGYAAEHIEQVTLVDPQGNLLVVSDNDKDDDDWMWMVRGSASAFPGVVVEFKIRLAKVPAIIRLKMDFFPVESYSKIIHFLNDYYRNEEKEGSDTKNLELTINLASTPPPLADVLKVPKVVMVIQTWRADSEEQFQEQVAPLALDKFPVKPLLPESSSSFQDMTFAGLSQMLSGAYPPGQTYIARVLFHESQSFDNVNWENVQESFMQKAPMGLSHCMVVWSPKRLASKPGCYGKYSATGFTSLTLGICDGQGGEEVEAAASCSALEYVEVMMGHLEKYTCKYDPLEYPLNKDTFEGTFPDGVAEKLKSLRAKVDPQHLFFDPSIAEPSH